MPCLVYYERSKKPRRGHVKSVDYCYFWTREDILPGLTGKGWVMGIGESVMCQDQKITLPDNCYFDSERERYFGERGKGAESVCYGPDVFFHRENIICREKQKELLYHTRAVTKIKTIRERFGKSCVASVLLLQDPYFGGLLNSKPHELTVNRSSAENNS